MLKSLVCMRHMFLLWSLLVFSGPVAAYIGPGAGLGAVAVTIAMVVGFLFIIVGFIWFPLKRKIRARREASSESTNGSGR